MASKLKQMEKTISLSELEADPERVAKDIRASGTVYRIRRPGRPTVLLRQLPDWAAVIDVMMNPNWREDLERSRRELAEGKGHDLETVLAELGLAGSAKRTRQGAARRAPLNRGRKGRSSSSRARGLSS